jgi:hypothetical protein
VSVFCGVTRQEAIVSMPTAPPAADLVKMHNVAAAHPMSKDMLDTAKTRTTGGRDGASHNDDDRLAVTLSSRAPGETTRTRSSCSPSVPRRAS